MYVLVELNIVFKFGFRVKKLKELNIAVSSILRSQNHVARENVQ